MLWLKEEEEGGSTILLFFNQQYYYLWNNSEWGHFQSYGFRWFSDYCLVIWKDILAKSVNGLFPFLSQRVIVILKEFSTNPRNVCWEGTRTDFSGWIVNPSSRKAAIVALIILKQISKVSRRNSDSSITFTGKCPFDLSYLNGGVKTFVKTLRAFGGKDNILMVFILSEQFQIFLVIFMKRIGIGYIFQFCGLKITTLSDKLWCIFDWI